MLIDGFLILVLDDTLPKTNSSPLKSYLPNRKVVFQPPFFRGYVKLWGSNSSWEYIQVAAIFVPIQVAAVANSATSGHSSISQARLRQVETSAKKPINCWCLILVFRGWKKLFKHQFLDPFNIICLNFLIPPQGWQSYQTIQTPCNSPLIFKKVFLWAKQNVQNCQNNPSNIQSKSEFGSSSFGIHFSNLDA